MDVKYTLGHEHQSGPILCYECDKWIVDGDAVSVVIESLSEDGQPLTSFLHKACAKKVGLLEDLVFPPADIPRIAKLRAR